MGDGAALSDILHAFQGFVDFLTGILKELLQSDVVELFDGTTCVPRELIELCKRVVIELELQDCGQGKPPR